MRSEGASRVAVVCAVLLSAVSIAGCGGGSSDSEGVEDAARRLLRELAAGDGAACPSMTPALRRELTEAATDAEADRECKTLLGPPLREAAGTRIGSVTEKSGRATVEFVHEGYAVRRTFARDGDRWVWSCCAFSKPRLVATREIVGTYRVHSSSAARRRLTADVVRARASALLGRGASVTVSGSEIRVVAPDTPRARAGFASVVAGGELRMLDWEANVIGPDGRPDPDNRQVTGGQQAATGAASLTLEEARRRAARGPAGRTLVVRAERPPGTPRAAPARYYVLIDAPALTSGDIRRPRHDFDPTTSKPIVLLEFSRAGRERFTALTRRMVRRAARQQPPGQPSEPYFQHFAIVLDDQILSAPFINHDEVPDGIDGRTGAQISGGTTVASARRLATLLRTGPLPARVTQVARRTRARG